jgi:diguanylate cyclase (GGDEF)-like protein
MKILVINNDLMERSVIQQVLQANKHEIVSVPNSAGAMQLLQLGDIRFVIADRATTDVDEQQFISRLREANPPYYIYVLLITPKVSDSDAASTRAGADDYLHKPVVPLELKSRVQIGERVLGLGDNLAQAREALDQTAMFETRTKMLNPTAFLSISKGELERARRNQAPLSLIALQVNNLREISEKHGPGVGNDVLVMVSQAIRDKSRPYDGTGLFDENIFLLPIPFVFGQDAVKIANRLFKGVQNTDLTLLDGTTIQLNISVGVVSTARVAVTTEMEALIEKAREALTHAQRNGGNQLETVFL